MNHFTSQTDSSVQTPIEVQIILAEYERQQQNVQHSSDTVTGTLTVYLTLLTFLISAGGAAAVWGQYREIIPILLASFAAVASVATVFTLFRTYQARVKQTDGEKSLSRLRNFLVTHYPTIQDYVADRITNPIHDDWPTPYTHPRHSSAYHGWLTLCIAAGAFAGLSSLFVLVSINDYLLGMAYILLRWVWWLTPLSTSSAIALFCLTWLHRKLSYRRSNEQPRFPWADQYETTISTGNTPTSSQSAEVSNQNMVEPSDTNTHTKSSQNEG